MPLSILHRRHQWSRTRSQRGVVLIMVLISLAILMIASVGLTYSGTSTLLSAGSLAFKRDLTNQSERAVAQVVTKFATGALSTDAALEQNVSTENYSATLLPTDTHGIPNALLSTAKTVDIDDTTANVQLRYVIDRMCNQVGAADASYCMVASRLNDKNGSYQLVKVGGGIAPVYRITVRATGPGNTEAFLQTTFTR